MNDEPEPRRCRHCKAPATHVEIEKSYRYVDHATSKYPDGTPYRVQVTDEKEILLCGPRFCRNTERYDTARASLPEGMAPSDGWLATRPCDACPDGIVRPCRYQAAFGWRCPAHAVPDLWIKAACEECSHQTRHLVFRADETHGFCLCDACAEEIPAWQPNPNQPQTEADLKTYIVESMLRRIVKHAKWSRKDEESAKAEKIIRKWFAISINAGRDKPKEEDRWWARTFWNEHLRVDG